MFFFAMNVIDSPLASIQPRKEIQSPWLPKAGVRKYQSGRNVAIDEIIIVLRIAFEAVAPM